MAASTQPQQSIEAKLLRFLDDLSEAIPSGTARHSITVSSAGKLILTVRHDSDWSTFYLEDGDIENHKTTILHITNICKGV